MLREHTLGFFLPFLNNVSQQEQLFNRDVFIYFSCAKPHLFSFSTLLVPVMVLKSFTLQHKALLKGLKN